MCCLSAEVLTALDMASTSPPKTRVLPCSGSGNIVTSIFLAAMVDPGKAQGVLLQLPGGATGECGTCITTKMGSPETVAAECLGKHLGSVATAVPTFWFLAARTLRPSTAAAQVCTGGDTGAEPGFAGQPAVGVCTEDSMQSLNNVPPDLLPGIIESLPSECRTCVAILSLSCSSSDGLADDLSTCMMQCMIGMSQLFVSLCCFALLSTLFREHRCAALLT